MTLGLTEQQIRINYWLARGHLSILVLRDGTEQFVGEFQFKCVTDRVEGDGVVDPAECLFSDREPACQMIPQIHEQCGGLCVLLETSAG